MKIGFCHWCAGHTERVDPPLCPQTSHHTRVSSKLPSSCCCTVRNEHHIQCETGLLFGRRTSTELPPQDCLRALRLLKNRNACKEVMLQPQGKSVMPDTLKQKCTWFSRTCFCQTSVETRTIFLLELITQGRTCERSLGLALTHETGTGAKFSAVEISPSRKADPLTRSGTRPFCCRTSCGVSPLQEILSPQFLLLFCPPVSHVHPSPGRSTPFACFQPISPITDRELSSLCP